MRTNLDFSPFFRSTIGFDRLFDLLEDTSRLATAASWPTYDIVKTGEDDYRITLAVPGFSMQDIEITQHPNLLVVTGNKAAPEDVAVMDQLVQRITVGQMNPEEVVKRYVELVEAPSTELVNFVPPDIVERMSKSMPAR